MVVTFCYMSLLMYTASFQTKSLTTLSLYLGCTIIKSTFTKYSRPIVSFLQDTVHDLKTMRLSSEQLVRPTISSTHTSPFGHLIGAQDQGHLLFNPSSLRNASDWLTLGLGASWGDTLRHCKDPESWLAKSPIQVTEKVAQGTWQ
jgi:hypothetical protein